MSASRRALLCVSALTFALAPAPVAQADTYCVNTTGCDHANGNNLQQALDQAQAHPGPDTVRMGPAAVTNTGGYSYLGPDPVHIEGSGGKGSGATLIQDSIGAPSDETILKVFGPGSTISDVSVLVPGGTDNTGIETNGTMSNVLVYPKPGTNTPTGVILDTGAVLADSDVLLPTDENGTAVLLAGSGTTVTDSRLTGTDGYEVKMGVGAGANGLVRRTRIEFSFAAFFAHEGTVAVEDSLLLARVDNSFAHGGVNLISTVPGTSLTANRVTLIGATTPNSTALTASTGGVSNTATIAFRNGIITGFPIAFNRNAGTGTANITTDFSDYGGTTFASTGAGSITETNHLDVDPGFLSPTDYHLRADSPLVDAGDPASLTAGESTTDLAGQPRIADGDGDCAARVDIGAFEFSAGPRAPRAAAVATPAQAKTGQPVGFDAAASCDPDGNPLAHAWSFDDGATATGMTVQHAFSSPGPHFGTVTVTDSTGRAATATAAVFVTQPPVPFAGVTIAEQKVKVSKKGVAKVKVKCPATATGSCAGALKLTATVRKKRSKLGSKRFDIPAGKTGKVAVKLSKASRAALRAKGRLKALATGSAHDGSGLTKVGVGTLTLIAPP